MAGPVFGATGKPLFLPSSSGPVMDYECCNCVCANLLKKGTEPDARYYGLYDLQMTSQTVLIPPFTSRTNSMGAYQALRCRFPVEEYTLRVARNFSHTVTPVRSSTYQEMIAHPTGPPVITWPGGEPTPDRKALIYDDLGTDFSNWIPGGNLTGKTWVGGNSFSNEQAYPFPDPNDEGFIKFFNDFSRQYVSHTVYRNFHASFNNGILREGLTYVGVGGDRMVKGNVTFDWEYDSPTTFTVKSASYTAILGWEEGGVHLLVDVTGGATGIGTGIATTTPNHTYSSDELSSVVLRGVEVKYIGNKLFKKILGNISWPRATEQVYSTQAINFPQAIGVLPGTGAIHEFYAGMRWELSPNMGTVFTPVGQNIALPAAFNINSVNVCEGYMLRASEINSQVAADISVDVERIVRPGISEILVMRINGGITVF